MHKKKTKNILVKERACYLAIRFIGLKCIIWGENSWSIAFWASFFFLFQQTYNLSYAAFPEKVTLKTGSAYVTSSVYLGNFQLSDSCVDNAAGGWVWFEEQ